MYYNSDGLLMFQDEFDLTYELLNTMDLQLRNDGVLYDSDKNEVLAFNGMIIKGSTKPNQIHYAGQGEIAFEPLSNLRMMTTLFGRYLQRLQDEGLHFISYFPSEIEMPMEGTGAGDEDTDVKYSNLTVKMTNTSFITTRYYHNKCLKFIEMIFLLDGDQVDLSNFDNLDDLVAGDNTRR